MGMGEVEFLEMRIGTFFLKLHYFLQKKEEEKRFKAELIRFQTWHLLNIQIVSDRRIEKPSDFWRFSWEEKEEKQAVEFTVEESEGQLSKLLQMHNRRKTND